VLIQKDPPYWQNKSTHFKGFFTFVIFFVNFQSHPNSRLSSGSSCSPCSSSSSGRSPQTENMYECIDQDASQVLNIIQLFIILIFFRTGVLKLVTPGWLRFSSDFNKLLQFYHWNLIIAIFTGYGPFQVSWLATFCTYGAMIIHIHIFKMRWDFRWLWDVISIHSAIIKFRWYYRSPSGVLSAIK